jgi:predicted transcriptional regulator of viral defense system
MYTYCMKIIKALAVLDHFAASGRCVFRGRDLRKIFADRTTAGFRSTLARLRSTGALELACRDTYVYTRGAVEKAHLLEELAAHIRRGEMCYVSLESALADYGLISQVPVDRLTVMTSGRSGEIRTSYGVLEFTHSARDEIELLNRSLDIGRPLRIASKEAALADLKRVGRNVHLLIREDSADAI